MTAQISARLGRIDKAFRHGSPVLLVDQLVAWQLVRDGAAMETVALRLRRYPRETRAILYGPEQRVPTLAEINAARQKSEPHLAAWRTRKKERAA